MHGAESDQRDDTSSMALPWEARRRTCARAGHLKQTISVRKWYGSFGGPQDATLGVRPGAKRQWASRSLFDSLRFRLEVPSAAATLWPAWPQRLTLSFHSAKPGHPSTFKGSECIIHCSLLWIWETCLGARYQADFKLTWPPRHETLRGSKGLGIVTRARAQCHAFEAAKLPLLYEKRFFYLGPAAVREIR